MHQVFAPAEAETVEQQREHLEVIVLLVAHHIYHAVDGIVVVPHLGGADVLGHVYRGTVGAQQQLVVEPLGGEVGPYGAVVAAVEQPLVEALEHLGLALEIGLRLIVDFVEVYAHAAVGVVKSGVHPAVHALPQGAHLGVAVFPAPQHLAGLSHQGRRLLGLVFGHTLVHELLDLGLEMAVKVDVAVADEMVALDTAALGSGAAGPLLPRQHRLADMYAAVVDDIGLHHTVATRGENLRQRVAQQIVAHMAQVEGLVGIGRRVLHHHQRRVGAGLGEAVGGVGRYGGEHTIPGAGLHHDVEKTLDGVEALDGRLIGHQPLADGGCHLLGRAARGLDPGEHHHSEVALKLAARGLKHHLARRGIHAVKLLYRARHRLLYDIIYRHIYNNKFVCKGTKNMPIPQKPFFWRARARMRRFFRTFAGENS